MNCQKQTVECAIHDKSIDPEERPKQKDASPDRRINGTGRPVERHNTGDRTGCGSQFERYVEFNQTIDVRTRESRVESAGQIFHDGASHGLRIMRLSCPDKLDVV
jgi:hypothetical protein